MADGPPGTEPSVLERLIRIEIMLETRFTDLAKQVQDHETRMRQGERYRLPTAVLVALTSAAITLMIKLLTEKN